MRDPQIDDFVRLTRDLPELALFRGEVGVIRSRWCAPQMVFEVEFHRIGLPDCMRTLLMSDYIEIEDKPIFDVQVVST